MSEPRTAAGRALLERKWFAGFRSRQHQHEVILAIEAEAALPAPGLDVETLAKAIEAANIATGWLVDPHSTSNFMRLERTRRNQADAIAAEYARLRGGNRG